MGIPLLLGTGTFGGTTSVSPNALIATWWNSLLVKPSDALTTALNTLSSGINSDGDWSLLDLFHVVGGLETDEQRLRPLISTSGLDFSAVNSPTLDATGVTGNGTSSYLNLRWIPSTNGINYTQNSASFGFYNRTNGTNLRNDMSISDGTHNSRIVLSTTGTTLNINDAGSSSIATVNILGSISGVRTGASSKLFYIRGVQTGSTFTTASNGLPSVTFVLCAFNNNGSIGSFSTRNYAMCYAGSGAINQLNFYNRIQTYMTTVGINV